MLGLDLLSLLSGPRSPERVTEEAGKISWIAGATGAVGVVFVFVVLAYFFFYNYGAAHLSYCYTQGIGYSGAGSVLWAVLAWLFSGFYYPYYSIFLADCGARSANNNMVGGKRRK
jgi:hypothetical protein